MKYCFHIKRFMFSEHYNFYYTHYPKIFNKYIKNHDHTHSFKSISIQKIDISERGQSPLSRWIMNKRSRVFALRPSIQPLCLPGANGPYESLIVAPVALGWLRGGCKKVLSVLHLCRSPSRRGRVVSAFYERSSLWTWKCKKTKLLESYVL